MRHITRMPTHVLGPPMLTHWQLMFGTGYSPPVVPGTVAHVPVTGQQGTGYVEHISPLSFSSPPQTMSVPPVQLPHSAPGLTHGAFSGSSIVKSQSTRAVHACCPCVVQNWPQPSAATTASNCSDGTSRPGRPPRSHKLAPAVATNASNSSTTHRQRTDIIEAFLRIQSVQRATSRCSSLCCSLGWSSRQSISAAVYGYPQPTSFHTIVHRFRTPVSVACGVTPCAQAVPTPHPTPQL